ncbi:hypothetical protein CBS101457_006840 [Exobasidium rhododendri]|nr:hypothetical protein CBS101457_006840 [Exobasidium rhododendri]
MYRYSARGLRQATVRCERLTACASRAYAVPVNRRSSVDPLLGIAPPPPPKAQAHDDTAKTSPDTLPDFFASTSRANNPNDLTDLLRDNKLTGFQGGGNGSAQNRSRTSAAIGAIRRGSGLNIPTQDLEDAFLPPDAPEAIPEEVPRKNNDVHMEADTTPIDREHPHPIDAIYGRNDLDERILAAARALDHLRTNKTALSKQISTISGLLNDFHTKSEYTLSVELPNESQPKELRRVPITSATSSEAELDEKVDDGVLLIAFVTGLQGGRGQERISVCSGFAIEGGDKLTPEEGKGRGALVVTCAHTLRGSVPTKPKGVSSSGEEQASSIALAITRSGHIFPVSSLVSSLPTSDLILLQLGEEAFVVNDESALGAPLTTSPAKIRTLPINPYPAQVGTELCVSSFWGWEDDAGSTLPAFEFHTSSSRSGSSQSVSGPGEGMQTFESSSSSSAILTISSNAIAPPSGRDRETVKRERDDAGRSRWGRARLVEYRDTSGQEARTGTYDDLAQLDFKLLADNNHNPPALQQRPTFPPPGSSGGPIVDASTGAIVGITRGTKMSQLEGNRGDGIPAEKIFFFFSLPGFAKK